MRVYIQKYEFLSFLDHFDIFRFRPTFVLNSKEKTSTITGKIITIGILVFLLYSFNESNVMNKTNPNTLSQDIRLKTRPSFWFSKENFTLVVGVADENNNFINDNTFFSINLKLSSVNNTDHTYQETSIIMKQCMMDDFKENPKEFKELGLKGSFCLPSSVLKLNGYWDEASIEYFYFEVRTCRNSTLSNIICQPQELIFETLNSYYLDFYITDHNVDSSNYLAPLSRDLKIYFKQLDLTLKKSLTIFMKRSWIDSDDGFFFESHKIIKTFGPGQVDFDVSSNFANDDLIFVINIYSSEFETNISRNYQKIQTLLAQLGGICNFLFFFGFVVSKFENRFRFITILGNELFIFPKSNPLWKQESSKSTKMETSHNLVALVPKSPTIMKISNEEKNNRGDVEDKTIAREKPENDKDRQINCSPTQELLKAPSPMRILPKYLEENDPPVDFHESLVTIYNENKDKSICDPQNIKASQTFKRQTTQMIKEKLKNMWEMGKSQLRRTNNRSKTMDNIIINNLEHYQTMKNKENFFSIGFWGFLKILLKSKKFFLTIKEKLFLMSETQISDQMDILKILKKLQDIDKLKRILLSEEQLYLFNLVSKPMIVLDRSKKELKKPVVKDKRFRFSMAEKPKLEKDKLITNYELVQNNSMKSEIDKRILKLLDEDVLSFLKNEA